MYKRNWTFLKWCLDFYFHYAPNSIKIITYLKNAVSNPFKNNLLWPSDSKKHKAQDLYKNSYPGMTSPLYFYGTAPHRFFNLNCVKPGYLFLYKSVVYRFSHCKQNRLLCFLVLFPALWFFKQVLLVTASHAFWFCSRHCGFLKYALLVVTSQRLSLFTI